MNWGYSNNKMLYFHLLSPVTKTRDILFWIFHGNVQVKEKAAARATVPVSINSTGICTLSLSPSVLDDDGSRADDGIGGSSHSGSIDSSGSNNSGSHENDNPKRRKITATDDEGAEQQQQQHPQEAPPPRR